MSRIHRVGGLKWQDLYELTMMMTPEQREQRVIGTVDEIIVFAAVFSQDEQTGTFSLTLVPK